MYCSCNFVMEIVPFLNEKVNSNYSDILFKKVTKVVVIFSAYFFKNVICWVFLDCDGIIIPAHRSLSYNYFGNNLSLYYSNSPKKFYSLIEG